MNDIAKMNGGLPANISDMVVGLEQAATGASQGGFMFLKLAKGTGLFVYGAEEIEVEEPSTWAINPMSLQHGWVAWGDKAHGTAGKNLGEHMGPAAQAIFDRDKLPAVEGSWSQQVGFDLACMDGEDEGTQVRYLTNSHGGKKAWASVLGAIVKAIKSGNPEVVPEVRLSSTSYKHEEYGKIHNPEFIVTGWSALDAAPVEEEEQEEEAPKPTRKRKAKAAPVEEEEEQEEAPAPTRKRKVKAKAEPVEEEVEDEVEEAPAPRRRRRKAS